MNIICENKKILRWSVFWIAWFLEKMALKEILIAYE